jgi:protein disulfide-isomerase A6
MRRQLAAGALVLLCVASVVAKEKELYSSKESLVEKLNSMNFHTHIKKPDSMSHVKLIEFHSSDCASCKSFESEYIALAKQLDRVVKVTAVDCSKEKKICDEYNVKTFPTLKVIPPGGFGTQDYLGERNSKAIYAWVLKFHSHFVEKVTADTLDAFLNKGAGKFKALLFTDKGKTPLMWRGLSVDLKGKMEIGVVQKEEKGVTSRFKVSKYPSILVVKPGQKAPIKFDGKMEYGELFEFLNRYQETFAMDNAQADEELAMKKPWLSEAVPELTSLSAQDICFGGDAVCVIVAATPSAEGKLPKAIYDVVMSAKGKYSTGNAKLNFMWVNVDREKGFCDKLDMPAGPAVAVLRTGKRTRYAKSETDVTSEGVGAFLDRVLGGDVQYKPLKEGPPALTEVKEEPKKDSKKK